MTANRTGKVMLATLLLLVLLPAVAFPGLLIFADGFEVCDASRWSSSTGLLDCSVNLVCPAQESGEAWMSGTIWDGRAAIRLSVSNWRTTEADIERTVAAYRAALVVV